MTIPHNCDALLPKMERAASLKFRRFARLHLDHDDGCELVAFLDVVPVLSARFIFGWSDYQVGQVRSIGPACRVPQMLAENNAEWSRGDGLAVLRAMQDGGWSGGTLPKIVVRALWDLRDSGRSCSAIGAELGMSKDQVVYACSPRSRTTSTSGGVGLHWA